MVVSTILTVYAKDRFSHDTAHILQIEGEVILANKEQYILAFKVSPSGNIEGMSEKCVEAENILHGTGEYKWSRCYSFHYESLHEKTCLWRMQPGKTLTALYDPRRWQEACNFRLRKYRAKENSSLVQWGQGNPNPRVHHWGFAEFPTGTVDPRVGISWFNCTPMFDSISHISNKNILVLSTFGATLWLTFGDVL